jgi:hypothetical protein
MALKTCPECSKKHGTRKKVCDCGYVFAGKHHPLYPEPGGWVLDTPKGLPKIYPPEPLPRDKKLTNQDVQDCIAYEGLGFAIYTLIPCDQIKDKRLAQLWRKTRTEMQKIVEHLEAT